MTTSSWAPGAESWNHHRGQPSWAPSRNCRCWSSLLSSELELVPLLHLRSWGELNTVLVDEVKKSIKSCIWGSFRVRVSKIDFCLYINIFCWVTGWPPWRHLLWPPLDWCFEYLPFSIERWDCVCVWKLWNPNESDGATTGRGIMHLDSDGPARLRFHVKREPDLRPGVCGLLIFPLVIMLVSILQDLLWLVDLRFAPKKQGASACLIVTAQRSHCQSIVIWKRDLFSTYLLHPWHVEGDVQALLGSSIPFPVKLLVSYWGHGMQTCHASMTLSVAVRCVCSLACCWCAIVWGPSRVSFIPRPVCMRLVGLIHIWVPTFIHAIHVLRVEGS